MAKNKLTETTHSFCHMCTGKFIFLASTAIAATSDCAPVHNNENMITSLYLQVIYHKKKYYLRMIKNRTHLKSFPESNGMISGAKFSRRSDRCAA